MRDSDYVPKEREIERLRGRKRFLLSLSSLQGNVRINLLRDYPGYTMFCVLPIVFLFEQN